MKYKYGNFSDAQMDANKYAIRKQIFFLLLIGDPSLKEKYQHVNVQDAFANEFNILNGLNSILNYPQELVTIICYLESALMEYNRENFNFQIYRKLILDAGNLVDLIGNE